jgi:hypothetical protein
LLTISIGLKHFKIVVFKNKKKKRIFNIDDFVASGEKGKFFNAVWFLA